MSRANHRSCMVTSGRILLVVLGSSIIAFGLAQPALASCADAAIITTVDDNFDPPRRTHIFVEGYFDVGYYPGAAPFSYTRPPYSPDFSAVWWELGRGAANNGSNGSSNWVYYRYNPNYGLYYGAELFGGWGEGGVNDCVQDGACTCVLMTDEFDNAGYWAITGNNNVGAVRTTTLTQPASDPAGNAAAIILSLIPEPFFVNWGRGVCSGGTVLCNSNLVCPQGEMCEFDNMARLTVRVDQDPNADYQLGTCDCTSGWKLYRFITSGLPPDSRDVADWTEIPGQPASGMPFGEEFDFALECLGTEDIFVATQIVAADGFATDKVSGNSTRIECDPTLADPVDDQPLRPFEVDRERRLAPRQGRQGR